MRARQGRAALAGAVATLLSACALGPSAPQVPMPDDPGFYAILDEDELSRLDGSEQWEVDTWPSRSDLSPRQQFVISDPVLIDRGETDDITIELWQIAWVRSTIRPDGSVAPAPGQWAVARMEPFRVPLSFRPVGEQSDALHIVPQEALAPGLYSLLLRQGDASRSARFGVLWSRVDKQNYSAAHCVDRRLDGTPDYQACTTATAAAPGAPAAPSTLSRDLEIKLVDPVSKTEGNQRILVLQGMVTNVASSTRAVPMLEAALQDGSGNVLGRWSFAAQPELLSPGQTATFRKEIPEPPAATARVNVTFLENASALP